MMVPDTKGRELEAAVHAIETVILDSSPALREKRFIIETRKRINANGVHHEIDIFVTVELAKGYSSTFVFECKNWEAPVGKNEIIVFSKKIDASRAQHGYFVAKSFTKDAEAQAREDPRMTLLAATEHDPAATPAPDLFHFTAPATAKASTTFRVRGSAGKSMDPIEVQGQKFQLSGREVLLSDYMNSWMQEIYEQSLLRFDSARLSEGIYPMAAAGERSFGAGECFINGKEMEHVRIEAEFGVQIIRPVVISDYEVSTRGRAVRLAEVKVGGLAFQTTFVTDLMH